MKIYSEIVQQIQMVAKRQSAVIKNVRFDIEYNEQNKMYDFTIYDNDKGIFIYIKHVNILSENDSEVLGRNFHAIKCKINKETFDLYVTE